MFYRKYVEKSVVNKKCIIFFSNNTIQTTQQETRGKKSGDEKYYRVNMIQIKPALSGKQN